MEDHNDENREEVQSDTLSSDDNVVTEKKRKINISIKTAVIIAVIIILISLAYTYKGVFVAATVDGSPISRLAVVQELEQNSGEAVLDMLITQKLINNEAKTKGIVVSDEEINNKVKEIDKDIQAQGTSLELALQQQGITLEIFKEQIAIQLKLEKLVGDKVNVTDEEVEQYITSNSIDVPEGQEVAMREQIKKGLRQQKLGTEIDTLINSLKSQASIRYFAGYSN